MISEPKKNRGKQQKTMIRDLIRKPLRAASEKAYQKELTEKQQRKITVLY